MGTGAGVEVDVGLGVDVALDEEGNDVMVELLELEMGIVLDVTGDVAAVDEAVMVTVDGEGITRVSIATAVTD